MNPINPAVFFPNSIDYAKAKAKHLRALLQGESVNVSLAQAQALTARALGHRDWHALDAAVKGKVPPSPLTQELGPEGQKARWDTQKTALAAQEGLTLSDACWIVEEWKLAGEAMPPTTASTGEMEQALALAWPSDERRIRREIRMSVQECVVDFITSLSSSESAAMDMRSTTLGDILGRTFRRGAGVRGDQPAKGESLFLVEHELHQCLVRGNDEVQAMLDRATIPLIGWSRSQIAEDSLPLIVDLARDRLFKSALEYGQNKSLWDLFFNFPSEDGLFAFRNSRKDFGLESLRTDDEDDGEDDDFGELGFIPPHARKIESVSLVNGMSVSLRQKPEFNEYGEQFRVTRVSAMLRTAEGDNVGFIEGRLFEADTSQKAVSKSAFFNLADSLDQQVTDMAEVVLKDAPKIVSAFSTGALLHVTEYELSKDYRGRGYAALFLEALVQHCANLTGDVSALCLDVAPAQFPYARYRAMPVAIRVEASRVSNKLAEQAKGILARPALRNIPWRCLRIPYPDPVCVRLK